MVFNSSIFIFFAILVYIGYRALGSFANGRVYQNRFLLIASYYFYGYWDWVFLGLIVLSTVTDYTVALFLDRLDPVEKKRHRQWLLATSMVLNLGLLSIFKYYDFFIESFVLMSQGLIPGAFPEGADSFFLNVTLPVGISFYTFQTMSYTIDVYRGVIKAEKNFLDFSLFVCFFPQLVAGPIERASDLLSQLKTKRPFRIEDVAEGLWLILLGFFLKVYVADNLDPIVNQVYLPGKAIYEANPELAFNHSGLHVLFASMGFMLQIYGDFAGYSFIAMGTALLLGIRLSLNFNAPEYSKSPDELWNRWHITLGRWVKDYIYIPLGGSRIGWFRKHANLTVAFALMGLWHGASWTFVLWGTYMGLWIVLAEIFHKPLTFYTERLSPFLQFADRTAKRIFVFILFSISAIMFRAYDLDHTLGLLGALLRIPLDLLTPEVLADAGQYLVLIVRKVWILFLLDFMLYRKRTVFWVFQIPFYVRIIIYFVLYFFIVIQGQFGKDVIYFAF